MATPSPDERNRRESLEITPYKTRRPSVAFEFQESITHCFCAFLLIADSSFATDGYFVTGFGAKQQGQGGELPRCVTILVTYNIFLFMLLDFY
jgi:hypothetical protein